MKVAITVWENRISPVFDSARMMLLVDIENGEVTSRCDEALDNEQPLFRADKLSHLGVNVLICGAISKLIASLIENRGIRIIPFIVGDAEKVLDAYLKDLLDAPSFQMPR